MNRIYTTLILILVFTLVGCAQPGGDIQETPEPAETDAPDNSPTWQDDLSSEAILLQLEYEPTFFRPEAFHPFGRIPPFTLYADGTVIYLDEGETFDDQQLMEAQIERGAAFALLEDVMEAGFAGLEDHVDFCGTDESGEEVCIADAAFTILRARGESGDLQEVRSYAGFSNDRGAFEEIVLIMQGFAEPDAVPYQPESAGLFIRSVPGDMAMPVREWPLSETPTPTLESSVIVLTGDALKIFIDGVGQNTGEFFFASGEETFSAYLVPWLPHTDYNEAAQDAFPTATPAPVEEPFMTIQQTAVANLAMAIEVPEDEIVVTTFEQVTWPNGCLGINYLDRACTEALVPGYRLILEFGGQTYEYRSDEKGSVVLPAGEDASPPVGESDI